MTDIQSALEGLGLTLPAPAAPVAAYVPARIAGNQLIISGQLPFRADGTLITGRLGEDMDIAAGAAAAQACALMAIAQAGAAVGGDWSRLTGCLRLGGFVNATPAFTDHPKVINGASELMEAVFGEDGRHARAAVGVSSLPLGAAVEVEALFGLA